MLTDDITNEILIKSYAAETTLKDDDNIVCNS